MVLCEAPKLESARFAGWDFSDPRLSAGGLQVSLPFSHNSPYTIFGVGFAVALTPWFKAAPGSRAQNCP